MPPVTTEAAAGRGLKMRRTSPKFVLRDHPAEIARAREGGFGAGFPPDRAQLLEVCCRS
jgi:hypothetical protein